MNEIDSLKHLIKIKDGSTEKRQIDKSDVNNSENSSKKETIDNDHSCRIVAYSTTPSYKKPKKLKSRNCINTDKFLKGNKAHMKEVEIILSESREMIKRDLAKKPQSSQLNELSSTITQSYFDPESPSLKRELSISNFSFNVHPGKIMEAFSDSQDLINENEKLETTISCLKEEKVKLKNKLNYLIKHQTALKSDVKYYKTKCEDFQKIEKKFELISDNFQNVLEKLKHSHSDLIRDNYVLKESLIFLLTCFKEKETKAIQTVLQFVEKNEHLLSRNKTKEKEFVIDFKSVEKCLENELVDYQSQPNLFTEEANYFKNINILEISHLNKISNSNMETRPPNENNSMMLKKMTAKKSLSLNTSHRISREPSSTRINLNICPKRNQFLSNKNNSFKTDKDENNLTKNDSSSSFSFISKDLEELMKNKLENFN